MELIDRTVVSGIASSEIRPVYNSTTIPINNNNNNNNNTLTVNHNIGFTTNLNGYSSQDEIKPFSDLPATTPVDIQFADLSYKVSVGFRKPKKEILHKVSGKFPGGQLIGIMGPSGAGKSTLLDCLSGYRETDVDGVVYLNGRIRNLKSFRKMSCYITQEDRLQPLLNVKENMRVACDLKLGTNVKSYEKDSRIEDILTVLGLYEHQFTLTSKLSGGQKKRLSIALELVSNPTIMFLDEPTTGLDSHSCTQVLKLCKQLAEQGRTIICTIHQPSAKLFQELDQVYILALGKCMYQGTPSKLIPYLESLDMPCPKYHNPADFVIEVACGEHGDEIINRTFESMGNGESLDWFEDTKKVLKLDVLRRKNPIMEKNKTENNGSLEATNTFHQIRVLIRRGQIKIKRDTTLTYLRIFVNLVIALMLGLLYIGAGNEGSRVLDNYNLLFSCLMHNMMTTLMLTVLTFPAEMAITLKENFNRWYSMTSYYISVLLLDIPLSATCCLLFSSIIYCMSGQPWELNRFLMFFTISFLIVLVAQGIGLMIGAWFNVVNGTFLAPTLSIPMMMFAGFGVSLKDLPEYLKWGSEISYLRYGLEGYVSAIYGYDRAILDCDVKPYCHYRYPDRFLKEISMDGDRFLKDVIALSISTIFVTVLAYVALKVKTIKR